jgi:hypoxia up-regulated 1
VPQIYISVVSGKLKGFFGDKAASTDSAEAEGTAITSTSTSTAPKAAKSIAIPLAVPVKYPTVAPMSLEQKREARSR